jgi:hypothetical protein
MPEDRQSEQFSDQPRQVNHDPRLGISGGFNSGKWKSDLMLINESLHIELIHANDRLVRIINDLSDKPGNRLTYEQSFAVAKSIELAQMAKADAKRAGITIEANKHG